MIDLIDKLKHHTRWQLYLRVLPVVALAVLLVGVCGSVVFTRFATDTLVEHEDEEAGFLLGHLRQQALIETMGLEARKGDLALQPGASQGPLDEIWRADLLQSRYLAGVALVRYTSGDSVVASISVMESLSFADSLASDLNTARVRAWFHGIEICAVTDVNKREWSGDQGQSVPSLAMQNRWHPTYFFAPLFLGNGDDDAPVERGATAVLPVLVCDDEREGGDGLHTIFLLSLAPIVADIIADECLVSERDAWWCVVDHLGRVVVAPDGVPAVGSFLKDQPQQKSSGPFAVTSGADLVGDWQLGTPWQRSLFGDQLNCWVISAGQNPEFPVAALIGHEARELRSSTLGFFSAVIVVGLLSLAMAVGGVTRAVGRLSTRLQVLSGNMAKVAEGDYSQRIPTTARDEVGRLMSYFNRMAASLEETRSQLADKTAHLETALEHRVQVDRTKDDFLVLISHEVRTPLTAIMGGVNILHNLVNRTTGSEREVLEKLNVVEVANIIESSGSRLQGFMNDALQMASIQASDLEVKLSPTPLGSLVELGLCGLREMAQGRQIEIVNQLNADASWQVLCDEKVMMLAFRKVLHNAVAHNYDGGRVEIREVATVPEQDLPEANDCHLISHSSFARFDGLPITWRIVEIFNTGPAIPAESREALFGKFELVGRIENHQRGSGLSLSIARAALEQHGGAIRVHSVKLQGNFFYLLLPTVATADLAGLPPQRSVLATTGRVIHS